MNVVTYFHVGPKSPTNNDPSFLIFHTGYPTGEEEKEQKQEEK